MYDALGDRIKKNYEDRTRYLLPRRTFTIIRLDGKAFHTFTRSFEKPYDERIVSWIDAAAIQLCKQVQGVQFAYTQSDEISLLLTDFETDQTEAWFDGNLQKIVSVASSIVTAAFNECVREYFKMFHTTHIQSAYFDARAFTIADRVEVANYFVWRQRDAIRNSISMLAQSLYSPKQLHGKNIVQQQQLCLEKGKDWNNVSTRNQRGGFIVQQAQVDRWVWNSIDCPVFTVDTLLPYIPEMRPEE
jgi:tRNA(His) guanylyltransferase